MGEYVQARFHVNTAEGFFSLLKRGINGVHHHIGRGHLHRYCDELQFRYNSRVARGVTDGEPSRSRGEQLPLSIGHSKESLVRVHKLTFRHPCHIIGGEPNHLGRG